MELRQLRYFVAVAEEMNFGRAAERLHIAGPSLSQQIKALERDLGVRLFDRDRRSVALTTVGESLLIGARAVLQGADDLRAQAAGLASTEVVRLGYVNWLPADVAARVTGVARVELDAWVLPSHAQAGRVADGSIDVAVCWIQTPDLAAQDLTAQLVGADRLYAVATGPPTAPVAARDTVVLLDADVVSWSSWNTFAGQFARATGATVVETDDSGITGPAFFDHVRRLRRPVVNSPKGQTAPLPADLVRRPIVDPVPVWTWSLVTRRDDTRTSVKAVVDGLVAGVTLPILDDSVWVPSTDPYRPGGNVTGTTS
ncbi:MAG TPA: LysR family transcriptional regulator [Amycolatopsis sp.]|nr:LysR family transcriptional regulator [Amycolatopsis sp.]